MSSRTSLQNQSNAGASFDLFRLTKSKGVVDISPNTLRKYFSDGLPCYRRGKATFVSKIELEDFIRRKSA